MPLLKEIYEEIRSVEMLGREPQGIVLDEVKFAYACRELQELSHTKHPPNTDIARMEIMGLPVYLSSRHTPIIITVRFQ
jgi:hypothetical protein